MAQLVARLVRNEKVRGSNPLSSTRRTPGNVMLPGVLCVWCVARAGAMTGESGFS